MYVFAIFVIAAFISGLLFGLSGGEERRREKNDERESQENTDCVCLVIVLCLLRC